MNIKFHKCCALLGQVWLISTRLVLHLLHCAVFSDRTGAIGAPGVHRGRLGHVSAEFCEGEHPGGGWGSRQEGGPPAHRRHSQVRFSSVYESVASDGKRTRKVKIYFLGYV